MAQLEVREIRRNQRDDPIIGKWVRAVIDRRLPKRNTFVNRDDYSMKKNFTNLKMIRGILYRVVTEKGETINQIVLPDCYRRTVLVGLHDDIGHHGRDRTLSLLRERFFWPGMTADVDKWITKCPRCLRRKSSTNIRAEMVSIDSTYPLELVCMDYLNLETAKGGFGNILVITDHFTKYALAIPTRNQTAKTTAEAIYTHFIIHYGIPTKLHSDQGANFESEIIKELCQITGITKTRTTAYHPMGNGQTERYNRTLLNMLGTLETSQKSDWKKYLPSLVYAYNCTRHETTRISPFELMFGRKPRLPIDSVFEAVYVPSTSNKNSREYIEDLRHQMEATQQIVKKYTEDAQKKQKTQFDKKAKAAKISVGDTVLVKILAYDGKHKIADKFEEATYTVIELPRDNIPVFKLRSTEGLVKTLHRNHLLPVESNDTGDQTDTKTEASTVDQRPIPRLRPSKEKSSDQPDLITKELKDASDRKGSTIVLPLENQEVDTDSEYSDEDIGYDYVLPTYIDGDAHDPDEGTEIVPEEGTVESVPPDEGTEHIVPDDGTEGTEEIVPDEGTEAESDEDSDAEVELEINVDPTGTSIDEPDRTDESEVREVEKIPRVTEALEENTEETETKKVEVRVSVKKKTDRATHETKGPDKTTTIPKTRQVTTQPPKPQPRRSDRSRKEPAWFDSYQMNQMIARPYDRKIQAVEKLISSGILNQLDSEIAHKMLRDIMEKSRRLEIRRMIQKFRAHTLLEK